MSESADRLHQALYQAEHGDLRPQFNPAGPAAWAKLPDLQAIEPVLLDRFFQLSRPIGDASRQSGEDLRLSDAGRFFYLVETLVRLGYDRVEEILLAILDEFAQLDERSYDELYLWSIVYLSRLEPRHVESFWPMVVALDQRYRFADWTRPAGVALVDQPYRLTDLLFYYYVLHTLERQPPHSLPGGVVPTLADFRMRYPSLGACLLRIVPLVTDAGRALVRRVLEELMRSAGHRVLYSDAYGLWNRRT
jgi:hypothetical protein